MSEETIVDLGEELLEVDFDEIGWRVAAMYVLEVARQVSGARFEVLVIPDPEGRNPSGNAGIYVEAKSLEHEDIGATMVVGYETDSLENVRHALSVIAARIFEGDLKRELEKDSSKLIVPEKKLFIPGT